MKLFLIFTAAIALSFNALAQVILRPGDSANLFTDPPGASKAGLGSLGWTADPFKDVAWIQVSGPTAFAYVVRDTTGLIVTPMDDFIVAFSGGTMWQEGSNLPEQVWLRVYLTEDALGAGDQVGAYALRSQRFGFDRPGAGPFEVPEARHMALLAAVGLLGFAAFRRFWK
jgi:hypothetical protein